MYEIILPTISTLLLQGIILYLSSNTLHVIGVGVLVNSLCTASILTTTTPLLGVIHPAMTPSPINVANYVWTMCAVSLIYFKPVLLAKVLLLMATFVSLTITRHIGVEMFISTNTGMYLVHFIWSCALCSPPSIPATVPNPVKRRQKSPTKIS